MALENITRETVVNAAMARAAAADAEKALTGCKGYAAICFANAVEYKKAAEAVSAEMHTEQAAEGVEHYFTLLGVRFFFIGNYSLD